MREGIAVLTYMAWAAIPILLMFGFSQDLQSEVGFVGLTLHIDNQTRLSLGRRCHVFVVLWLFLLLIMSKLFMTCFFIL